MDEIPSHLFVDPCDIPGLSLALQLQDSTNTHKAFAVEPITIIDYDNG